MEEKGMCPEWEYLETIPSFAGKKSSLSQAREFLGLLGHPDREFQIFHVAGTNGKGSVCAFLSSMLREAGISCGAFTSPHLADIRERFLINGSLASLDAFSAAFRTVREATDRWQAMGNPHPTYFEFLFYLGLVLFQAEGIQVLVLETGMGGLRDVTNVIEHPLACILTSISIDHTAYLGTTLREIAAHKAGIIKPGSFVVYDGACRETSELVESEARRNHVPAEMVTNIPYLESEGGLEILVPYRGREQSFFVPFEAPYQAENAALAIRAMDRSGLEVDRETAFVGIKQAKWPARMEQILPNVYLDGAHNADGIRAFLDGACMIKERKRPKRLWLLFGAVSDKEYGKMLEKVGERLLPDVCLFAQMDSRRAVSLDILSEAAKKSLGGIAETFFYPNVKEALSCLLSRMEEGDLAFIAGSLYLAGEVKAALTARQNGSEAKISEENE